MFQMLIIRHGNPIYETDTITEQGRRQAEQLAERISRLETIDALYVSPKGRAAMTASPLAKITGLKPKTMDWLKEVDRANSPWGKPHNEYLRAGEFADPVRWEDGYWAGDELRKVYEETASGLDELLAEYGYERDGFVYRVRDKQKESTICLVCHAGLSMVILSHLLQWHLPLCYAHIGILETGVARIVFKRQGESDAVPVLLSLNDISHLDDALWKDVVQRKKTDSAAM